MTIYYQHVGEKGAARDFPRTLGNTKTYELKQFQYSDIKDYLGHLKPAITQRIARIVSDISPDGFQIWGIPSGAKLVLKNMAANDKLLLLEAAGEGGFFTYCGTVIHRIEEPCHDLSTHLWGEGRFPIIILLDGRMILYRWFDFLDRFGLSQNFNPRGQTMSLAAARFGTGFSGSEEEFISLISGEQSQSLGTHQRGVSEEPQSSYRALPTYVERLRWVKDRISQEAFRNDVLAHYGEKCGVCEINMSELIEAAHIIPIANQGSNDPTNGLPLCALHHRAFDIRLFHIDPISRDIVAAPGIQKHKIGITAAQLSLKRGSPSAQALAWRKANY
jgi:HNH endonuclease